VRADAPEGDVEVTAGRMLGARRPPLARRAGGYLALLHPFPVAMTVLAAGLFAAIAARGLPPLGPLGWLLLSVLLSQIAIASLNDYCDRALDAATKPSKPIPAGLVSARTALGIAAASVPLALLASLPLGAPALVAAAVGTAGGLLYDAWAKGTRWSVLPFVVAFPVLPIWAWVAVAPFEARLLEAYLVGAPLVVGLHVADTWPDLDADRAHGVRGFAHSLGPEWARRVLWGAFAVTPLLLAILALVPGRPVGLLAGAAALCGALVAGAWVASRGGEPLRSAAARQRWQAAFVCLVGAAIVAAAGWLASLVA
jgi:4-hydroxybenzoate polyprenyltransferase